MRKGTACVAVLALVFSASLVSASVARAAEVPPSSSVTDVQTLTPCDRQATAKTTLYLPNVTKTLGGPQGWDTPFYVQNAGAVQTTVEASFYRFSDGTFVACHRTDALAPGTSLTDDPAADGDLPDDTQFSVVVKSLTAPIVATVDQLQGVGSTTEALSYSGVSAGTTTVYLPNVTRRFFGYDVPFIIQNLGTASTVVSARFVSFDGAQTMSVSRAIEPGRSKVIDPDSDDPVLGAPGLVDGTQYAVTLTSAQPIAVVANAHDEAIGPVAFSHNGLAFGGTVLYAPYAVKLLNGLFSPVVVQNVSTVAVDATLTFSPLTGGALPQIFTLKAIPPGGARAFDPRFTFGTTTPCSGAAPTCLGDGEYSLRIDGTNAVAAVVLPNSASTAAGYLASAAPLPRSVLPIVMRTVGGPSGWTTTMFVQPATATFATIRYYSLETGDLVTTQQLVLGRNGSKIDPRFVPGLRDNARYSVTVDGGTGTLVAVAHQLAFTGGDASMMFEGGGTAALPTTPQPGSVRVQPSDVTVLAGATQQFTATVRDQLGEPLPSAAVTWNTVPGTISASGVFTAGSTSAQQLVLATSGAATTTASINVQVPAAVNVGGFALLRVTTAPFDLYLDPAIVLADQQRIVTQSISDVAQVERDYAAHYTDRPAVYVLSSPAQFAAAARAIGGSSPPTWASGLCACFGTENHVFVDWSVASDELSTLRHELTHAMEHDVSADADLPAWFNEGNALQEEFTEPGTQWFSQLLRYRAASMAFSGSLFTLDSLTSQLVWNQRSAFDAKYEYAAGAQAVGLLRSDIGMLGELDLIRRLADGATFADAYAAVAHRSLDDFAATFAARIKALAPVYPGVVAVSDTPEGPGLSFVIYGLPKDESFALSIAGSNGFTIAGNPTRTADAYGVYSSFLSAGWPPGSYTISATWSGGTVSVTATKPAVGSISFVP